MDRNTYIHKYAYTYEEGHTCNRPSSVNNMIMHAIQMNGSKLNFNFKDCYTKNIYNRRPGGLKRIKQDRALSSYESF